MQEEVQEEDSILAYYQKGRFKTIIEAVFFLSCLFTIDELLPFRSIGNDGLRIVQPDTYYFGGLIRSMKVARMAHAFGKSCTPHMSGGGLGYLYMMHFVSALPNALPHHEFKGFKSDVPFECKTSPLVSVNGVVKVPTGPGLGVEIDPAFVRKHQPVGG